MPIYPLPAAKMTATGFWSKQRVGGGQRRTLKLTNLGQKSVWVAVFVTKSNNGKKMIGERLVEPYEIKPGGAETVSFEVPWKVVLYPSQSVSVEAFWSTDRDLLSATRLNAIDNLYYYPFTIEAPAFRKEYGIGPNGCPFLTENLPANTPPQPLSKYVIGQGRPPCPSFQFAKYMVSEM